VQFDPLRRATDQRHDLSRTVDRVKMREVASGGRDAMRRFGSAALAVSLALGLLGPAPAKAQSADWSSAIGRYNDTTYFTRAPLKSDEIESCALHWERWHQAMANGEVPAAQVGALPADMRDRSQETARGWREQAGPQPAASTLPQIIGNRLTRGIGGSSVELKLFFWELARCRPLVLTETKARSTAAATNSPLPAMVATEPTRLCDPSQFGLRYGFAGGEAWYINNEPIVVDGKRYEKNVELPRQLASMEVKRYSAYRGAEVYVLRLKPTHRSPDEIYVLLGAPFGATVPTDCLYQPYRPK
jgi:hypothetical protein